MINEKAVANFEKAVESLRQYRRYELVDDKNRDLLNSLYVDPMDNDGLLNLCLKDNTTVLIGRKGTGKSTIFMRMQNELRSREDIITCYIDVKNIFDRAKRNYTTINYLGLRDDKEIEIYSIQRKFIIDFVTELIKEIEKSSNSLWDKVKSKIGMSKSSSAIKSLTAIKNRISNNEHLQQIELQAIQEVSNKVKNTNSEDYGANAAINGSTKIGLKGGEIGAQLNTSASYKQSSIEGDEKEYNRLFARIFEITNIIDEIKKVLEEMKLKRLYIILDDYSEIDQTALRMFCDLIVNTLNNNSDNFIKLKISAYPGRVELGELDSQKIDIRYLDYYQLYRYDKRSDMESSAINYTKRIIDKRLEVYTGKEMADFFDTTRVPIEEYYKLIFKMTLNVVRHIGLILDYAKDNSLYQGKLISMANLYDAAKRLYDERLKLFFKESQSVLMDYNDRVGRLQLEHLLGLIVSKAKEVKSNIRTNKYEAVIFDKDRSNPYCSHFHISLEYEELLASLELNFFVNKYNEMSNKSGKKVSIFSLNYGLALYENIKWGKPVGNEYRTYFIESPFNFNPVVSGFLNETKKIQCNNPKCRNVYNLDELPLLQKYNMNCLKCMSPKAVEEVPLIANFEEDAKKVEEKSNLLEADQYRFLSLAVLKGSEVTAQEMAQELDTTIQKIGWLTKKLEEDYYYLVKDRTGQTVKYRITELGKGIID
ncbi:hypothetical protein P4J23_02230 [Bacillus cereus]|uniref:hypothetical protein n=1 Tax=Bacillus cereus TaxID=1396 RepID=UPI000470AA3E|nr:hypothetical protein [Bacillus cereus]ASI71506.1 hypothetical protein BA203_04830 [Bacillus cereus]MEB9608872.1 hypothetical protein [Bacillus cereus]